MHFELPLGMKVAAQAHQNISLGFCQGIQSTAITNSFTDCMTPRCPQNFIKLDYYLNLQKEIGLTATAPVP